MTIAHHYRINLYRISYTYRLEAGPAAQDYVDTVLGHPAIKEWIASGQAETEVIQAFED